MRRQCILPILLLAVTSLAGSIAAAAEFRDVTLAAGISYIQRQVDGDPVHMADVISGGAAAGDYDGDGWTDLYVTRLDATDLLYRNRGDGTFEEVADSAFGASRPVRKTNGATWGDIDNDGDLDLYVTSLDDTRFYLYINDGRGQFAEQGVARGAAVAGADPHFGMGAAFGDYDRDGYVDLYVTEWRSAQNNPTGARGNSRLLRNRGAAEPGYFDDVTDAAGVNLDDPEDPAPSTWGFTPWFTDFDRDGWIDLAVAADFGASQLFWNNRDGSFTRADPAWLTGLNHMGSAIADVDGDGWLDWFISDVAWSPNAPDGNRLYRNLGKRSFADVTDIAGVRDGGWGWGAAIFDYDNDGDRDIAMTNGWPLGRFATDPMRLWQNSDDRFREIAAEVGLTDTGMGRGLLVFDYDRDGDQDLFVVHNGDTPILYANEGGNQQHWLRVDAAGSRSNRTSLGAWITVDPDVTLAGDTMVWEVNAGSHFLGQSESISRIGLGDRTANIDLVEIRWPSGQITQYRDVPVDRLLVAVQPVPEPASVVLILVGVLVWTLLKTRTVERAPVL